MARIGPESSLIGADDVGEVRGQGDSVGEVRGQGGSVRRQASADYAARAQAVEGPSAGAGSGPARSFRRQASADYAARAEALESRASAGEGALLANGKTASNRSLASKPSSGGMSEPQPTTHGRQADIRTDPSSGALSSASSRVPGPNPTEEPGPGAEILSSFSSRVLGAAPREEPTVTVEELMESGVHVRQASARIVQHRQQEVLGMHFRRLLASFVCLVLLMAPVILGVLIWMGVEWNRYRETECDVPLQTWVSVVIVIMTFNSVMRKLVIQVVCGWVPPQPGEATSLAALNEPLRVRLFNASIALFVFVWNCVGLHWVRVSGTQESESPSCKDVAPGLVDSVRTYAAINLCFSVILFVYLQGALRILAAMMRAGVLQTSEAAPPGSLQSSTERVDMTDKLVKEHASCSICLEDFNDRWAIVRTKQCKHVFHKQCLHGWLKVQKSCPLCRQDLSIGSAV